MGELSLPPPTRMSNTEMLPNLRQLLCLAQPPLPSRPTKPPSNSTRLVSLPQLHVEQHSTTPSDTVPRTDKTTSLSRTPGAQPGEIRDTSSSEPTTLAVSSDPHQDQPPIDQNDDL